MRALFNFSILALIWSVYYLAKRITGGVADTTDAVVCGIVIAFCIGCIARCLFVRLKKRKKDI